MIDIERHQLELRYAGLRVVERGQIGRLVASLSQHGQQSPVLVVAGEEEHVYVLIDGYARVEALGKLGRDLVRAIVLDEPEHEALILAHRLEAGRRRTALEEGWLVAELLAHHGLTLPDVAERLQRSVSWVSRRLALVKALTEPVRKAIQEGVVCAQAAMKSLVPLARANRTHCERLVAGLGGRALSVRQADRLYSGWRQADKEGRERIVEQPWLFLKAEAAAREPALADGDPAAPLLKDLDAIAGLSRRACRRVHEGLLEELDQSRRARVARGLQQARLAFDSVCELVEAP